MPIGTSMGLVFDSEMDWHSYNHAPDNYMVIDPNAKGKESMTQDKNIVSPNQMQKNKEEQKWDLSIDNPFAGIEIGLKEDQNYIKNIDKSEGFFLKDEMQQQPWKKYSDRAKDLTKQTYDLYRSGDVDTVNAVQNWEKQILGRGYNDTEEGKRLKKESFEKYGSKTTMSEDAMWETYMQHLQNLAGADVEMEGISDDMREQLENLSKFDRVGRAQIDFKKHWADGKFK